MTCIVALKDKNIIVLGGDSFAGDNFYHDIVTEPKVFQKDEYAFGFCGSFRLYQILKYETILPVLPKKCKDITAFLVKTFVPKIRKQFEMSGFRSLKDNVEGFGDEQSSVIIVIRGKAYVMYSDFSIVEFGRECYSIGAGAFFALGAFSALRETKLSPEKKVEKCLTAATDWCNLVKEPYHLLTIKY